MATDSRDRALYIISVAAELAGVHPQTLRIYERKGLIEPSRTEGRSRRTRIATSRCSSESRSSPTRGSSLAGARKVLELEAELDRLRETVEELQEELTRATEKLDHAVDEVHRSYRRDLVPVRGQAVVRLRPR